MMRRSGVYKIINITTLDFYIGSAVDIPARWYRHVYGLRHNNHTNKHLQSAWNKYGEASFVFEVLEEVECACLLVREQYWIDSLMPKYNICRVAGSSLSVMHSDETKNKLKQLARTEERAKIRKETSNRIWSDPEHRAYISKCAKEFMSKPENIARIVSRNKSDTMRRASAAYHTKTYTGFVSPAGAVYADVRGLEEFCKRFDLSSSAMSRVNSGHRKHHKGWTKLKQLNKEN